VVALIYVIMLVEFRIELPGLSTTLGADAILVGVEEEIVVMAPTLELEEGTSTLWELGNIESVGPSTVGPDDATSLIVVE